jgi:hypothetical protein
MKHASIRILFAAALLAALLPAWQAAAQSPSSAGEVHVGQIGYVDWLAMEVVGRGTGLPPAQPADPGAARSMAVRAAVLDARRNLLEVIKGVHIDSRTRVVDFIVKSDVVRSKVLGFIQGAEIGEARRLQDGSYLVEARLPLTGPLGRTLVDLAPPPAPTPPERPGPGSAALASRLERLERRLADLDARLSRLERRQAARTEPRPETKQTGRALQAMARRQEDLANRLQQALDRLDELESQDRRQPEDLPSPTAHVPRNPGYTGLVVDARDLGFRPSLRPSIYGGGELLYPTDDVDPAVAEPRGYVRYYQNVSQAQQSERAGSLPLTVRAAGLHPETPGALRLPADQARLLKAVLGEPDNFLAKGRVVIVF